MNNQVETAIRATINWIFSSHCAEPVAASVWGVVAEADGALKMLAEANKRERNKLARQGFGAETLKDLQFAIADAGLWPAHAKGAAPLGGRAYDLNEGLALAGAL